MVEGSSDGENWEKLVDETGNQKDAPHALCVLNVPETVRYLRITNAKNLEGCFSLFDLRVFGHGNGSASTAVTGFTALRDGQDKRIYRFSWDAVEDATGYILYWGTQKDKLTHSTMLYDNHYEARYFNRDSEYYFDIVAFNENGLSNNLTGK